eukprot:Platyproteum_vivax@DN14489_c0_g1_i1.p1
MTAKPNGCELLRVLPNIEENELMALFEWFRTRLPNTRVKTLQTSFQRDFSDGVVAAQLIHHCAPKLIQLHNYSPSNTHKQKATNWALLNDKVFVKLKFKLHPETISQLAAANRDSAVGLLKVLQSKLTMLEELSNDTRDDDHSTAEPTNQLLAKEEELKALRTAVGILGKKCEYLSELLRLQSKRLQLQDREKNSKEEI